MSTLTTESLEPFLQRQDASTLVAVLLELTAEHEPVQQRLSRGERGSLVFTWRFG
jgi:hypothetical protein